MKLLPTVALPTLAAVVLDDPAEGTTVAFVASPEACDAWRCEWETDNLSIPSQVVPVDYLIAGRVVKGGGS